MYKETYLSDAISYRHLLEDGLEPTLPFIYNEYLTTPPREFGEQMSSLTGLFFEHQVLPDTNRVLVVAAWTRQVYWPSWNIMTWRFNGTTGAFLGYGPGIGNFYTDSVVPDNSGSLWVSNLSSIVEYNYTTAQGAASPYIAVQTIPASRFSLSSLSTPMIDKSNDIAIFAAGSAISVYNLTSGVFIRTINVSGVVKAICQEDDTRCYVLTDGGFLNLVDYATGEVISTTRSNATGADDPYSTRITWDHTYRRLLIFEHTATNENGSSKDRIHGFYPVPLAKTLTKPIPLTPPRKYRTTPVLTRLVGDVGEPIGGVRVAATASDEGVIVGSSQVTDNAGYAVVRVRGEDVGTTTVSLTAEVLN